MNVQNLPTLNAILNTTSAILLIFGYRNIKRGKRDVHKKFMLTALAVSILFFISYSIYHSQVGSVPYPRHDWTRPLYFALLIPHAFLAAAMVPFIILAVWFALKSRFAAHKKIVRWLWPVWIFVSVSGVVIYVMLYHL